ncbi:hypothetical protein C1H46_011531 [Malus baccata]|uniref:Ribosomal protein L7Ae/L30e/S12e/Gadd45 domain-containing protein n=1 Tax=Malus baccata TaxID=106549 RepID=A0A540MVR5_MALBA|nr:hypothetical protein C1H46_011531 [Malus baccata]
MSVSLTVMTFNFHEDQTEDSPYSWDKRKDLCISVITSYYPMILCTQQEQRESLREEPSIVENGGSEEDEEDPREHQYQARAGKLIIISNNCPPLRKSEIEYYAMLAKVGVHHYNGNMILILTCLLSRWFWCHTISLKLLTAGA